MYSMHMYNARFETDAAFEIIVYIYKIYIAVLSIIVYTLKLYFSHSCREFIQLAKARNEIYALIYRFILGTLDIILSVELRFMSYIILNIHKNL